MSSVLFHQITQNFAQLDSRIQRRDSSKGEQRLAICNKCNSADSNHEIHSPSKRYELKNGKKVEVCAGFSGIPVNFYDVMKQEIPQKVIAI